MVAFKPGEIVKESLYLLTLSFLSPEAGRFDIYLLAINTSRKHFKGIVVISNFRRQFETCQTLFSVQKKKKNKNCF